MQRLLLILGLLLLVFLLLPEIVPAPDAYFSMDVQNVSGRPQLVLQYQSSKLEPYRQYIGIYTAKGDSGEEWEPLLTDRLGPSFGTYSVRVLTSIDPDRVKRFAASAAAALSYAGLEPRLAGLDLLAGNLPEPRLSEQLGLFHSENTTLVDLSQRPPQIHSEQLPFKWLAETTAVAQGVQYAFGVEFPGHPDESQERLKGRLRAARFNGQSWDALEIDGPEVDVARQGFLLKAVAAGGGIRIFWRDFESDQLLAAQIEGLRVVTGGKLHIADFKDEKFGKVVEHITGLPRGNICAWGEGPEVKLLIQTRAKPETNPTVSGAMEVWGLLPGHPPVREETVGGAGGQGGLLAYLAAERFVLGGQEYILRSNWQKFELWKRGADKTWELAAPNVKLPAFKVEGVLVSSLFLGLALLAFSGGLAWRRRTAAAGKKIHPREIYAAPGVRMGAFVIDLALIVAAAYLISQPLGIPYTSPLELLQLDLNRDKWPFFIVYIAYMTLGEWLLGASLGKYAMGLRVLMFDGKRTTFSGAAVRNLTGFFERMPQVILVPVFMMFFSPYRQRLGDLLSRTIVVHKGMLEAFKSQRAAELAAKKAAASPADDGLPSLDVLVGASKDEAKEPGNSTERDSTERDSAGGSKK